MNMGERSLFTLKNICRQLKPKSVAVLKTWQHRQSRARSCHLDRDVFSSVSDVTTERKDNNCSIREHAGPVLKRAKTRVVSCKEHVLKQT